MHTLLHMCILQKDENLLYFACLPPHAWEGVCLIVFIFSPGNWGIGTSVSLVYSRNWNNPSLSVLLISWGVLHFHEMEQFSLEPVQEEVEKEVHFPPCVSQECSLTHPGQSLLGQALLCQSALLIRMPIVHKGLWGRGASTRLVFSF